MLNIKVIEFSDLSLKDAKHKKIFIDKFLFWSQENTYYSLGFDTELILRKYLIEKKKYKTIKLKISKDFYSNGANIPFFLKKIFPPIGRNYEIASFYHDFLYTYGLTHGISRLEADQVFYEIMKIENVKLLTRGLFFLAVRIFGSSFFGKISEANQ